MTAFGRPLLVASAAAFAGLAIFLVQGPTVGSADSPPRDVRAITLDARHRPDSTVVRELAGIGFTHITMVTFGFQRSTSDPEVRFKPDGGWFSESVNGMKTIASWARDQNMGTIVKPHIWVGRYSEEGQTRGDVGYDREFEWQQWETSYSEFILFYADFAEDIHAEMFVIGTELARAATERPEYWRRLITDVRSRYSGRLTYAANWYEEYDRIQFWDDLDAIGVQAYFPLSDRDDPHLDDLRTGWEEHATVLRRLSDQSGKPIFFTELGYRSVSYAAETPWRWRSRSDVYATVDLDLQARLYEAFLSEIWPQPWFEGFIVWKWKTHGRHDVTDTDFEIRGKPAAEVLRRRLTVSKPLGSRTDAH